MESGYQQEPVGGGRVRFTVRPAPAPRGPALTVVPAALFALAVVGTTPPHAGLVEILARLAIAGWGGGWLYRRTDRWFGSRIDRRRSPGGTFVVSPFGIEPEGARIEREQLKRLIIRNGVARAIEPVVSARAVRPDRVVAVAYMLCAETATRSTVLAGGMTETTALGLLTDVSRILGGGRPVGERLERCASAPSTPR